MDGGIECECGGRRRIAAGQTGNSHLNAFNSSSPHRTMRSSDKLIVAFVAMHSAHSQSYLAKCIPFILNLV